MKNALLIVAGFFFLYFLFVMYITGQARIAIQIENEQQFCSNKGFTDVKVCREFWIKSGAYKQIP